MKLLMTLFLLGLPGVAQSSRLYARQGAPSGNSSVVLQPPQSSSSQSEPVAPSLVATSTRVTIPSSTPKQERGPQGPDDTGPPDPPPAPIPGIETPTKPPPPEESPARPTTTSISETNIDDTTTFAFSSPTITGSAEISSDQLTTIATTSSPLVVSSPTTLFTSTITPSVTTPTLSEGSGTTISSNSQLLFSPTNSATMSDPTSTSSSGTNDPSGGASTVTIILSTVLSVTGVFLIAVVAYLCTGGRRKRLPVFNRGITPIGDDEIATWKSNRSAEKVTDRYTTRPTHSQNPSTASTRRAPSVIQYGGTRPSLEVPVTSPRSFISNKHSFDLPQPPVAVLARAPNARSGLTDEAVPGDDPFLPSPKRHPSRLHKLPPGSPGAAHGRTKGSRSSSMRSFSEAAWRDAQLEISSSPRGSSDANTRSHHRIYSNSSIPPPPRLSFGDNEQLTGLSPPPSRRNNDSTIGLAVG
ncbi:hypothetical protein F5Y04DRAFT_289845 [Hypomontagnella monticulosa]|nr:hypothetical protein F5Y04DRAFT_289845 [Hypomontagnella monticulosa]